MIQKFRVSAVRPTLQASCLKSVCHTPARRCLVTTTHLTLLVCVVPTAVRRVY